MEKISGYKQVSLKDMIEQFEEDKVKSVLFDFFCPLNKDVEKFIREKAIEFTKQNIAPTHLIFSSYKGEIRLIAYFTLTIKNFFVSRKSLSNSLRKRICKFGIYDEDRKGYMISAPLIAQLGKNYKDDLSGDYLIQMLKYLR